MTPLTGSVMFDLVEQPLFVFAPVLDQTDAITDLTFVDMNVAARNDLGIATVPVGDSVRAWLTDLDLLWAAANRAWVDGRAEPYDLEVRRGRQADIVRSYTIETAREGDHIVQVAAPRTDARLLREERDRFAGTLNALDDGVIVLRPVVDGTQVLDARIEFVNAASARFFRPLGSTGDGLHLVGLGVGEVVERSDVAEAIVGAVAAALGGDPTSMILDNASGAFPLLAQPSVRLAFVGESSDRVIMVVQDISLPTFAEHQSTLLNDFGRSVVNALDRPAFIVRVAGSDVVIDQAGPDVRAVLDRSLPCTLGDACGDEATFDEVSTALRRVIERSVTERHLSLRCPGSLDGSIWTLAPLPGNRVFAVAERSPGSD